MSIELKIGSDPESFIRNKKTGQFVSAEGIIPGDKKNPYRVDKGAVQVDGLAAEFNIDPATTAEEFSNNLVSVTKTLDEMVKKHDKDLEIVFTPFANFDPVYFEGLSAESKILGCDPDFDYNGAVMPKDEKLSGSPFRTAAGHIHIGFTEGEDPMNAYHFEDCRFLAKHFHNSFMDYIVLGRYRTIEETKRLKYYGGKGAFRPKSYGVELRQFSNVWVRKPEDHIKMFDFITNTIKNLAK